MYGRWIDVLKCTDYESYEEYYKDNSHKFKRHEERSKSPNESPANTPRKVFSKLNSFKMSSFKSLSIADSDEPAEIPEGEIPRSHSTYSLEIPNSTTLWEVEKRPENSAEYFQFTDMAMSLNEMEPQMRVPETLCCTDSRLRPDIKCLENGDLDGAASEKNRLEEKQRDCRKLRKSKKNNDDWHPR